MTCMQLAGGLWNIDVSPPSYIRPKLNNFMWTFIPVIKWCPNLMRQSKSQKFEKVWFEQNISQDLNNRLLTIIEKPEERMRKPINNLHFHHSRLQQPSQLQPSQQTSGEKNIRTNKMTQSESFSYLQSAPTMYTYWIRSWIFLKTCGTNNQKREGRGMRFCKIGWI